jgi:hypothetical protein
MITLMSLMIEGFRIFTHQSLLKTPQHLHHMFNVLWMNIQMGYKTDAVFGGIAGFYTMNGKLGQNSARGLNRIKKNNVGFYRDYIANPGQVT